MEETEARIIKKGRGTNLIHLGYMYSRDRPGPDGKIYWRCTKKPRGSCNARAHTKGEGDELRVIHQTDHTHEPDEEAVATATIKADFCCNTKTFLPTVYTAHLLPRILSATNLRITTQQDWRHLLRHDPDTEKKDGSAGTGFQPNYSHDRL